MFYLCFSFVFNCYHIKYFNIYVFCFLEDIFLEMRHYSLYYIYIFSASTNRKWVTGFKLNRIQINKSRCHTLIMHGSSFQDKHLVSKELLKW